MDINLITERLRIFYRQHKRLPTYGEMCKVLHYKSKGAVRYTVRKLLEEEILAKDETGALVPKKLFSVPHMGIIKAGSPIPAESIHGDSVDFYNYILNLPDDIFCLTVRGDSMIEAGIHEGDLVLIERRREPREGDIVAATIDGECTLKELRIDNGKYYLAPANRNYRDIYPLESLNIDGVVINVIRRYH